MKRKVILLIIFTITLILSGCVSKKEEETKGNPEEINFYEVKSYLEKEDNWIYTYTLSYTLEGKISYRCFNGYNMKYDTLDGYYIPVIDSKTKKEVDKMLPSIVNLVNDQIHAKEFNAINDFFDEKEFTSKITLEDLNELECSYFSKEDLVTLYNSALDIEPQKSFGKYDYPTNLIKSKDNEDNQWQIAILGTFGYIEKAHIDIKYKDGTYLSDLIKMKKATKDQQKTYQVFKNIEKEILKNGEIDFDSLTKDMSTSNKAKLKEIISELK